LSPLSGHEKAAQFLSRVARAIAKSAHGVIFDPQTEVATLPNGISRFAKSAASDDASLISMNWWFTEGPIVDEDKYELLLDVCKSVLPEALPRRYGQFEPPQSTYTESTRDEFLSFLRQNVRSHGLIWYPTAPVADVHFRIPDPVGESKMGFRSAYFTVTVDAAALEQPG
jgi:hypothetical protein